MGLPMLLSRRIKELQRSETGTSHEKEGDILNVFDFLLIDVLKQSPLVSLLREVVYSLTLKIFKISRLPTTMQDEEFSVK